MIYILFNTDIATPYDQQSSTVVAFEGIDNWISPLINNNIL